MRRIKHAYRRRDGKSITRVSMTLLAETAERQQYWASLIDWPGTSGGWLRLTLSEQTSTVALESDRQPYQPAASHRLDIRFGHERVSASQPTSGEQ